MCHLQLCPPLTPDLAGVWHLVFCGPFSHDGDGVPCGHVFLSSPHASPISDLSKMKCLASGFSNFKIYIDLIVQFYKEKPDGVRETILSRFNRGCSEPVNDISAFNEMYNTKAEKISEKIDTYVNMGSGWILEKLVNLRLPQTYPASLSQSQASLSSQL